MNFYTNPLRIAWVLCLTLIAVNFSLVFSPPSVLIEITQEDGIIENGSAIFLLVAAIVFFVAYVKSKTIRTHGEEKRGRNLFFLLLGLFFFVCMGEEISWGQRIFNVETPDILVNLNYQEEINLHNFRIFEGKNPDGSQKGGLSAVFTSHRIFYMLILAWTLLIPVTYKFVPKIRQFLLRIHFPVHPIKIGILALSILIFARLLKVVMQNPSEDFNHGIVEIAELNLAVVIAYAGFYWLWHTVRQGREEKAEITFDA
ncbi:MAG: hypothetical protein HKN76_21735 [Saprospiraceae bacterium]|nr:hypothetical protein [Saprospiraceae bacterium]